MKEVGLNRFALVLFAIGLAALALTACEEDRPTIQTPIVPFYGSTTPTVAGAPPTAPNQPGAQPTNTLVIRPGAATLACPAAAPTANAQLAARVNGIGIPLDLYNRQIAQAQAAMVSQGLDPNSAAGKEALKSLKQQVLDQLINDIVIALQAEKEGVKFTENDF